MPEDWPGNTFGPENGIEVQMALVRGIAKKVPHHNLKIAIAEITEEIQ
jgi:hypothetical protein